ncbi:MAG TPA: hypothetical protein VL484_16010 [Vicinamibacterales bacterium]|jgi:hypothetical protein|nr:hypothetical protein [Vicinamibacterales bacterium]
MATPDQPKARPVTPGQSSPGQAPKSAGPAGGSAGEASRPLASAFADAAKRTVASAILEKRPYLKYAFANPYNVSLFGGALAAAGLTLNPVLAVAAVGLEALWLLYAPDSKRLRHLLWDPRFEQLRDALLEEERAGRLQLIGEDDRGRVRALIGRQQEIRRLAAANPSFTGELLRAELLKADRLVDAFIDMAVTCTRYEQYLKSVDLDALARGRMRWEAAVKSAPDGDAAIGIAKQNLAIILKRLDKLKDINQYLTVARGQLDLIDNSFQLIADQVVTMQSPQQLSGQLDDLLDGVESIRQTAVDTDRILGSISNGTSF